MSPRTSPVILWNDTTGWMVQSAINKMWLEVGDGWFGFTTSLTNRFVTTATNREQAIEEVQKLCPGLEVTNPVSSN